VTQGEKFDPDGAGVRLGTNFPRKIVEHDFARRRFLETAKKHLG